MKGKWLVPEGQDSALASRVGVETVMGILEARGWNARRPAQGVGNSAAAKGKSTPPSAE
jgi:hypothetical protein